jgi:iron(III) transport system permease protein
VRFGLANYITFLTTGKYLDAIVNSLLIALTATVVAGVLGTTLAYLYARYKMPMTSAGISRVTMASVSPPFLGAYAWRMLLGSSGIIPVFWVQQDFWVCTASSGHNLAHLSRGVLI